jgi:hypothetical protein
MKARASENDLAIVRSASTSVDNFWAEIYWGRLFFRAESSLIQSSCRSFIRVIVPYEISKVNFRVEIKILVSMSISVKQVNKVTFITQGFRVSVVSDVRERVRDFRITFALYVKKIFIS